MKKSWLGWSRAAMGTGTVIFGALWLNNLASTLEWHCRLFGGAEKIAGAAEGGIPWLAWSALDASTVTTFVPFFGFLLMWIGVKRPRFGENWPFFEGYERLNVALGLLGTIWGIILIGFYPVGEVTINALMYCLHTAMFSTLAAVAWVMVLMPLAFRPWLNAIRKGETGEAEAEDGDWENGVERLLAGLRESGGALAEVSERTRAFAGAAEALQKELQHFRDEVQNGREAEAAWRNEALAGIRSLAAVLEAVRQQQTALTEENLQLQERKQMLESDLASARAAVAQLQQQLDAIRSVLR